MLAKILLARNLIDAYKSITYVKIFHLGLMPCSESGFANAANHCIVLR